MEQEFRMPDLGEGLAEAEVVRWLVTEGERISLNQLVAEVETAKAIVELPSPYAGTVTRCAVAEGETVAVGATLLAVESDEVEERATSAEQAARSTTGREPQEVANLVGSGPRAATGRVRGLKQLARVAPQRDTSGSLRQAPGALGSLAAPPVRKYAKDHGLDLAHVLGSGPGGRILRSDLTRSPEHSDGVSGSSAPSLLSPGATAREDPVEVEGERIRLTPLRRTAAAQMTLSATTIPQATAFLTLDAGELLDLRDRLRLLPEAEKMKITPLAIISRSVCSAISAYPLMNASLIDAETILVHRSIQLGIATDTPFGLVVPTIRGAERLGVLELAGAIDRATARARDRRASVEELTGGTFTITNVGAVGIEAAAALVNPPQSAILAVGRILERPWVVKGAVAVRPVMTLGVSFDHRMIDGAYAAGFLTHLQRVLEHPALLVA